VDGGPSRRNKAAFSDFYSVYCGRALNECDCGNHVSARHFAKFNNGRLFYIVIPKIPLHKLSTIQQLSIV